MKKLIAVALMFVATIVFAEGTFKPMKPNEDTRVFYIYSDAGSRLNHYIPSGWMGSFKSLKFDSRWKFNPKEGTSCIRIVYDINKDTETSWAGIYWVNPVNNWGDRRGGYDLSGFKSLTFWVRGTGYIEKFGIGGITGTTEDGDSDGAEVGPIELKDKWEQVTIDLRGIDLSHIIGGFYFATNSEYNDKNVELFLDEIRYEK